jgi:hypothetical protein
MCHYLLQSVPHYLITAGMMAPCLHGFHTGSHSMIIRPIESLVRHADICADIMCWCAVWLCLWLLAALRFRVESDPLVDRIDALLPQTPAVNVIRLPGPPRQFQ